jgi:hypothetical protein
MKQSTVYRVVDEDNVSFNGTFPTESEATSKARSLASECPGYKFFVEACVTTYKTVSCSIGSCDTERVSFE